MAFQLTFRQILLWIFVTISSVTLLRIISKQICESVECDNAFLTFAAIQYIANAFAILFICITDIIKILCGLNNTIIRM